MSSIVVSQGEADRVATAQCLIEVCDNAGAILGYITPPVSEKDIAIARSRMGSKGPGSTIDQVLEHLQSLGQQ
ncbi:MAG TPA: hypothetical protein VJ783_06290 [Pirellulales bacterium]|nr:hypothetical protein [Pirellulales bacterium]